MLLSNKDELVKVVNQIAENINQTINTSMDKLVNENGDKKRKLSKRKRLFNRSKAYFTRSRRKSYLIKSKPSTKNMKRIYLTKYSLNLIKRSIKGFVNEILI